MKRYLAQRIEIVRMSIMDWISSIQKNTYEYLVL